MVIVIARNKQEKYIDLNQFVYKNGKISWVDNVGNVVEFFNNGERHELEILERINKNFLKIRVDDAIVDNAHITKIKNLTFEKMFYKPKYFFNVGDIVNNKCEVVEKFSTERRDSTSKKGTTTQKAYKCRCLKDNYLFTISESELKAGHGCPVCCNQKVISGVNDVATTDPDLIKYFVNQEDAKKYSRNSGKQLDFKCLTCGSIKNMRIADLTKNNGVFCSKCSDGISYPNKFAHEMFSQLSGQYVKYETEYSPEWFEDVRYDNYIVLNDGTKLLVEMDGGYHYHKNEKFKNKNDDVKTSAALNHGFVVIRVNCNYDKVENRFDYIKNNTMISLGEYFDLSNVDWNKCNEKGIANKLVDVLAFYESHPKLGLEEIAENCHISMPTLYGYLQVGEKIGLCKYKRADSNRIKNSKPVSMHDMNGNFIGNFKSAKQVSETFPELNFSDRQIRKSISENKTYKGHKFNFVSYEEYQAS